MGSLTTASGCPTNHFGCLRGAKCGLASSRTGACQSFGVVEVENTVDSLSRVEDHVGREKRRWTESACKVYDLCKKRNFEVFGPDVE